MSLTFEVLYNTNGKWYCFVQWYNIKIQKYSTLLHIEHVLTIIQKFVTFVLGKLILSELVTWRIYYKISVRVCDGNVVESTSNIALKTTWHAFLILGKLMFQIIKLEEKPGLITGAFWPMVLDNCKFMLTRADMYQSAVKMQWALPYA